MLNQSLRGQLQHDRERHAREANERLNATHPDPRRAIPMDFQLVPEDEVREKRKLKAFLDNQVQQSLERDSKQAGDDLQQHQFVLQCLQEELMRERNLQHKKKLQNRQMISNEWDRQATLGGTQMALGYHKVH